MTEIVRVFLDIKKCPDVALVVTHTFYTQPRISRIWTYTNTWAPVSKRNATLLFRKFTKCYDGVGRNWCMHTLTQFIKKFKMVLHRIDCIELSFLERLMLSLLYISCRVTFKCDNILSDLWITRWQGQNERYWHLSHRRANTNDYINGSGNEAKSWCTLSIPATEICWPFQWSGVILRTANASGKYRSTSMRFRIRTLGHTLPHFRFRTMSQNCTTSNA